MLPLPRAAHAVTAATERNPTHPCATPVIFGLPQALLPLLAPIFDDGDGDGRRAARTIFDDGVSVTFLSLLARVVPPARATSVARGDATLVLHTPPPRPPAVGDGGRGESAVGEAQVDVSRIISLAVDKFPCGSASFVRPRAEGAARETTA